MISNTWENESPKVEYELALGEKYATRLHQNDASFTPTGLKSICVQPQS